MLRAWIAVTCIVLLHTSSYSQEPWAVLTGQSILEVRAGLRHIYQRLGRKDLVAALDSAAVTNLISGNLKGLDLTRPLGSIILPNQKGAAGILTFIPVTNEQEFIEFLRRHLLNVHTDFQGNNVVDIPLFGQVYLRVDKNVAWLAFDAAQLQLPLHDMTTLIPEVHRRNQLAATIYLDRIPHDQKTNLLQRGEQVFRDFLNGSAQSRGKLVESLAIPLSSSLMKRLADDSSQITMVATSDRSADQLRASILITPKPDRPWLAEVQRQAQSPVRIELSPILWARIRGKTDVEAEKASQSVFKNGKRDVLVLSVQGGNQLELKAELPCTLLAYHAALNEATPGTEKKTSRRERRRIPRH